MNTTITLFMQGMKASKETSKNTLVTSYKYPSSMKKAIAVVNIPRPVCDNRQPLLAVVNNKGIYCASAYYDSKQDGFFQDCWLVVPNFPLLHGTNHVRLIATIPMYELPQHQDGAATMPNCASKYHIVALVNMQDFEFVRSQEDVSLQRISWQVKDIPAKYTATGCKFVLLLVEQCSQSDIYKTAIGK